MVEKLFPGGVSEAAVRFELLQLSPESLDDIFNSTTGQYQALQWITEWLENFDETVTTTDYDMSKLSQRWAMASLYFAGEGADWILPAQDEEWLSYGDECDWTRISCNARGKLMNLDLGFTNFIGTLPREISLLSKSLVRLSLDRNDLIGTIPTEIGKLTRLAKLDFDRCDLSGTLPTEVGELTKLEYFSLGRNDLSGPIPEELGGLQDLEHLALERNDFVGKIPTTFKNLEKLEYLALDYNALTGTVPKDLGQLPVLGSLILARNDITGVLGDEFCRDDGAMIDLAADCREVACRCCTLCCVDSNYCPST